MCAVPEHGAPPFGFAALHRAFLDCRRGKGNSLSRWKFESRLERNLVELADELQTRRYRPAPSVCFVSDQPKRREIFAAAFRDRVVHHLLVRQIEPWWEAHFIHDSYACRRGKGTLAAVDRVQQFVRQAGANGTRRAWFLHLDVRSFFVRIDKQILFAMIDRGIERQHLPHADAWRWLVAQVLFRDASVDAHRIGGGFAAVPAHKSLYHTGNATGLPIGNYSSQFFANIYLDRLDQFVKHVLRVRRYVRYVDDLLLIDRDRDQLLEWEKAINAFLDRELSLELNPSARRLAPVSNGIDTLGYIVHHDHRLLRRRTVRRFEHVLKAARCRIVHGGERAISLHLDSGEGERLMATCMSYRGMLAHADSWRLAMRLDHRHQWIRALWQLDAHGRVRRRLRLTQTPRCLADQWRGFRRRWSSARIVGRISAYWEAHGADAVWLRTRLGLQPGRGRGCGAAAGFRGADRRRLRAVLRTSDAVVILLSETGRYSGSLRERVVHRILVPYGRAGRRVWQGHWLMDAPGSAKGKRRRRS